VEIVPGRQGRRHDHRDDNRPAGIETVVERDRSASASARASRAHQTPIRVTLHAKALEAIAIAGSGDVLAHRRSTRARSR
jgi:hypothetical protein